MEAVTRIDAERIDERAAIMKADGLPDQSMDDVANVARNAVAVAFEVKGAEVFKLMTDRVRELAKGAGCTVVVIPDGARVEINLARLVEIARATKKEAGGNTSPMT